MPWIDILFALIVASAFSTVLISLFGKRGPGPLSGFPFFFVVLFFTVWAAGVWLTPFGPLLRGTALVTYVMVGAIVTLIIAAVVPEQRERRVPDLQPPEEKQTAEAVETAFGFFFRVLILVLIGIIISRYVWWTA